MLGANFGAELPVDWSNIEEIITFIVWNRVRICPLPVGNLIVMALVTKNEGLGNHCWRHTHILRCRIYDWDGPSVGIQVWLDSYNGRRTIGGVGFCSRIV